MRLIKPKRFADERGWFCETYSQRRYAEQGAPATFRQDNLVFSKHAGVLRGLHFQRPPHAQAKLVSCLAGRIWDVAVDIRAGSPTFGEWQGAELSAENGLQAYIPVGCAHGYVTLEPDTLVEYKVSDFYAPECEGGIAWDDPKVAIDWPLAGLTPILSDKDERLPRLEALASPFVFDGEPFRPLEAV